MKMWNSKLQFVEQKCSYFIGVVIKSTDGNEPEIEQVVSDGSDFSKKTT